MKRAKEVFCQKCAYLLLIKTKKGALPLCVGTAKFVGGPIRERIDIRGIVSAVQRNFANDCEYYKYKLFTTKLTEELKAWARRSINGEEARVEDYSIEDEIQTVNQIASRQIEEDRKRRDSDPQEEEEFDMGERGDSERGAEPTEGEEGEGDDLRGEFDPESDEEVYDDSEGDEGEEPEGI